MKALKTFCNELVNRMEGELLNIRLEYPATQNWSEKSIPYLKGLLEELKTYIMAQPFKKRSEEIYFFKEVKPIVMGRMIFMCEVHNREIFRPALGSAAEKDYLENEINKIDGFFRNNLNMYEYYQDCSKELDIIIFVRQVEDRLNFRNLPVEIDPVTFYGDPAFSTGFDYQFAKFRAYQQLRDHLENELEALLKVGDDVPAEKIKFIGSRADFLAMIEIFKNIGSPVNPKTGEQATDEELFHIFKKGFNTDIPDDMDYNTLSIISGNSDLPERMLDALDNLKDKWDEENRDIDYDDPDGDKPKE